MRSDREALTPNRGAPWPWDGHLHALHTMDIETLRHFVQRDRDLWALADTDPDEATRLAIDERVFFRRNPPRLGEPIYRSEEYAERDRQNMYCGRGTGHLGTGLYFFGTLRAAVDSVDIYRARADELRQLVRGIYAVDMEHVPDDRIYMPTARQTQRMHAFANALICWPVEHRRAEAARRDAQAAEEAFEQARLRAEEEDSDEAFYAEEEARDELREAKRDLRSAVADLSRRRDTMEADQLQPNVSIDELLEILGEPDRTPSGLSAKRPPWEPPAPRAEEPLPDVPAPPPAAANAIERYLQDVEAQRFPGYHPMTYYMTALGYEAVLHASWGEFNSGDIGNLWYP